MASGVLNSQKKEILAILSQYPDGLGSLRICRELKAPPHQRTVQRWLNELVEGRFVVATGKGRATVYGLVSSEEILGISGVVGAGDTYESYMSLSDEGREIIAYVRRPRQMRLPVGYNRRFLEDYRPGITEYLPKELRDQLRIIGTPPAHEQPAGTFARDILSRLLIDLSWASSRLEGNTYSRLDTQRLIELGQAAEGKDALETQMILNHKAAVELLVNEADGVDFVPFTLFSLHALLSDGLLADQSACGRIRRRPVDIGGSVYRPVAMPQTVDELFRIVLSRAREIADPFEQAFFVMVHLPYLQPFEDVNKRVSRLAANISLIRSNLCPLSFIDVPEQAYVDAILGIYEMNRIELLRDVFVWAYERSCQQYLAIRQELKPPDPFRLRYRLALGETVREMIRHRIKPNRDAVAKHIPASVAGEDIDTFISLVLDEFKNLHEGNAIRFGIRPSEYSAWLERKNSGLG